MLAMRICPLRAPIQPVSVHERPYHHAVFSALVQSCWIRSVFPALWRNVIHWSREQDVALRNMKVLQKQ